MTRSRVGLVGLLVGVVVGARAWRRRPTGTPPAGRAELLAVAWESRSGDRRLAQAQRELEARARRRTGLTVALVAVASLPAVALAVRPDVDPVAGAVTAAALALLAIAGLLVAARTG